MADIGSVAAAIEPDNAALGMRPDLAQQLRAAPGRGFRLRQQRDGTVEPDRQHIVIGGERGEGRAMLQIGPEAADAGGDRLAGLGVGADIARQ